MQQDYEKFTALGAEVVVIAPDTVGNAEQFFANRPVPFVALADDTHEVYDQFDVQSKWTSLGQRPGLFIIDQQGIVQFAYIGSQQWEIPSNEEVISQIEECCKVSTSRGPSHPEKK